MLRRRPGRGLPVYQTCLCGKTAAATLQIAKNLKREITARTGQETECRYYRCNYGQWHWTEMLHIPYLINQKESA